MTAVQPPPAAAGPLDGIRVLDLTEATGAYATKLLADLGADVLRVEPPGGGGLRRTGPFLDGKPGAERGFPHRFLNAGKRSVVLDLAHPGDRDRFLALVEGADALVEDGRPGALHALGLGYPRLAARRPGLVMTSITGFGQDGPWSGFQWTDAVLWALGGVMTLAGDADRPPLPAPDRLAYGAAGCHAALATLTALLHVAGGGDGQWIDVSVQEAVALAMENAAQCYDLEGMVRKRAGNAPQEAGTGRYAAADGSVWLLTCLQGRLLGWEAFLAWMEREGVAGAGRFAEDCWRDPVWRRRPEAVAAFDAVFAPFAAGRSRLSLYESGQACGVNICPLERVADALENPQLRARGFFRRLEGQRFDHPGPPWRFAGAEVGVRRAAPALGEHGEGASVGWTRLGRAA